MLDSSTHQKLADDTTETKFTPLKRYKQFYLTLTSLKYVIVVSKAGASLFSTVAGYRHTCALELSCVRMSRES